MSTATPDSGGFSRQTDVRMLFDVLMRFTARDSVYAMLDELDLVTGTPGLATFVENIPRVLRHNGVRIPRTVFDERPGAWRKSLKMRFMSNSSKFAYMVSKFKKYFGELTIVDITTGYRNGPTIPVSLRVILEHYVGIHQAIHSNAPTGSSRGSRARHQDIVRPVLAAAGLPETAIANVAGFDAEDTGQGDARNPTAINDVEIQSTNNDDPSSSISTNTH